MTISATRDFFNVFGDRAAAAGFGATSRSWLYVIEGEGRWLIRHNGERLEAVEVDQTVVEADARMTMSRVTFENILAGRQNIMLAYMSRKMKVEGDRTIAMDALQFQKLV